MKKTYLIVLAVVALVFSLLGLVACNKHTHTLEHFAAVEASCETEGNVEYWLCTECGQYFADQDGSKKISHSDVVIHVLGHDRQEVAAVAPTCSQPGNTAGYTCSRCDYSTVQTLPPSHDMTHHAEVPVSCFTNGVKEYWTCSRENGVYYANEAGTAKLDDITIYATGHDMTYQPEVPATCTKDGVKGHWICSREKGIYFADEAGSETFDNLAISAIGHDMSHVDALAATCTENGHIAHWVCAHEDGVYYANEDGTQKIANIVTRAIGHNWDDKLTSNDTHHWYVCNNGCGELGSKQAHSWGNGIVTKEPTTKTEGERYFLCDVCSKEKTQIIPMLETFTLTVIESDIYNNQDGGTVTLESDTPLEDDKYVEGSVVTVTVTLKESFGIGSIYVNDDEIVDSPLVANGVYTFEFVMKGNTTLTVEFGKLITTTRPWQLRDGGGTNFAFPWEYYRVDAAQDGNGTAMLYVYEATGINAREYDFTTDKVFFIRELYHDQALAWNVFNQETTGKLMDLMRQLPAGEQRFEFTLAFAIRLFPSVAKRASGYVASELILPTATTVGGVDYDMTADYVYSKADLSAPNTPQFSINEQGTAFEFLRLDGAGSVFTKYFAAYIEIEMRNKDTVRYAYLFNENGTLCMYSNMDKTGTRLSLSSVNNAWILTSEFNNWAMVEYPDAYIYATLGWEFRTKIHVDDNSYWIYDGEWSEVIKHIGFSAYDTPSFKQMDFNKDGTAMEFIRLGGKGLLFTKYHASYVEIEIKQGDTVYKMYLFYDEQARRVYLYANDRKEGDRLDCGAVDNAAVSTVAFNAWASNVFEANFNALEWEYRTKVHVDDDNYDSYWFEDGEWSEVIKYEA
ncbi:MAG: hypothetical protein J1G02_01395 [Clostridiales bacterium]|nr:hypothetical protein [Clostridiales bacterium]